MRGFGTRGWTRRAAAALLAMLLAVCAGGPAGRDVTESAPPAPGSAAMRVALDPETGTLGMPPAGSPLEAPKEPPAPPRVETLPNGMMILHHDGHFRNYSLAARDAHGRIRTDCTAGAAAARQALAQARADSVPCDAYGRVVR